MEAQNHPQPTNHNLFYVVWYLKKVCWHNLWSHTEDAFQDMLMKSDSSYFLEVALAKEDKYKNTFARSIVNNTTADVKRIWGKKLKQMLLYTEIINKS